MKQLTGAPRRPIFEEPPRLNRRIYYGAVRFVKRVAEWVAVDVPCFLAELLVALVAPFTPWIIIGLLFYAVCRCSTDSPPPQDSQALKPAQEVPTETHRSKHSHRTHRVRLMPAASAASPASHVD